MRSFPNHTSDFNRLDLLNHAFWQVKLHGDLSPLGRYGAHKSFWRQLDVKFVIDASPLECSEGNSQNLND